MKEQKFHEAFQVVKKIAKYFPANPDRLTQIIRLTIITKNYEDMELYYEIFTQLEERNSEMTNYIGAGLFVAGKWYLLEGQLPKAMPLFEKIAVSCAEFSKFLRAIISLLVEHKQGQEAEKFISRFPAGSMDQEDYLVSDFLLRFGSSSGENGNLIKRGMEIYNRNIRDYQVLSLMVNAMVSSGLEDKAKTYRQELERLFPEKTALLSAS